MGLGKKKEDEDPDLEAPEVVDGETAEGSEEPEVVVAPEPELSPAMLAARDGARVCALINEAIQGAGPAPDDVQGRQDPNNTSSLPVEAQAAADRAAGTWLALENGSLSVQSAAVQGLGILANEDQLAELGAAVIIAARDDLQHMLGQLTVADAV